ncbi:MAG: LamG domain-containing protein, partial [Flavobacterium sp.]|nr:LamG domain-containing protein [Flavobacterium sp.]
MKKITLNLRANNALFIVCFISTISFGQNLYDSNGTIIWDATANSTYNYNVDLIGRDDNSLLNKKQNTDVSPQPMSLFGLGTIALNNAANPNTFPNDRSFLVWGDNNNDMTDSGSDVNIVFNGALGVTTSVDIPNKIWKLVESGDDVATTRISIPTSSLSGLPALLGNDAYVLVVADNDSFTSNVETVFLIKTGSNQIVDFDFDGTKFFTFGVAHQNSFSGHLAFDGIDDLIKFDNTNNLPNSFSMMFWIRPTGQNSNMEDRTIASKYDGISGYRIYLSNDNKINVLWSGGTTLKSNTVLPNAEWHNIAISFSGNTVSLYIDCVLDTSETTSNPIANNHNFSIGAEYRNKSDIRNYFKGDIDEFRIWNRLVNLSQLKFVLNQEMVQNGA